MKLDKSYIRQLISEQLQELKSPLAQGAEALQPEDMPGAIAGLLGNAAAQGVSAQLAQQTLMQILEMAGQVQDPQTAMAMVQAMAQAAQGALEAIPAAAEDAAKDATGQ